MPTNPQILCSFYPHSQPYLDDSDKYKFQMVINFSQNNPCREDGRCFVINIVWPLFLSSELFHKFFIKIGIFVHLCKRLDQVLKTIFFWLVGWQPFFVRVILWVFQKLSLIVFTASSFAFCSNHIFSKDGQKNVFC